MLVKCDASFRNPEGCQLKSSAYLGSRYIVISWKFLTFSALSSVHCVHIRRTILGLRLLSLISRTSAFWASLWTSALKEALALSNCAVGPYRCIMESLGSYRMVVKGWKSIRNKTFKNSENWDEIKYNTVCPLLY